MSRLHRKVLGDEGIIVAFHRIDDRLPEDGLTRGSRVFERFCRFFKSSFDVVTLTDFVSRLERKESVAGKLAITFDDGYLDNYQVAAPILRKLDLPATFYVVTRFLESKIVPWWDAGLAKSSAWMTWDEVRFLSLEGFDIGAHTRTHVDLGAVDGSEAETEIAGSRQDILEAIGKSPEHFAFPYGQRKNLLESNRQRVIDLGFRSCVSCHGGLVPLHSDPFKLERIPISAWFRNPEQFAFEVLTRR
jgi:peptidoglycan/xylan/chitin deacetylase (PgdA/CDA1 family)